MLFGLLRSDWIKLKRTTLRWGLPLFFTAYSTFMIWYSKHLINSTNVILQFYKTFFGPLGLLLPTILSVCASLIIALERNAGNFQNVVGSPFGKTRAFISKSLLLSLSIFFSVALSTSIFIVGIRLSYGVNLFVSDFFFGMVAVCLSCISMVFIFIALSFSCSISALISIGFFGSLVSAILSVTSLGFEVWWSVPFTYPAILPLMPFYHVTPYSLFMYAVCFFVTLLFTAVCLLWFNKWEGNK